MWNAYEAWRANAVTDVQTVEEFLLRYYKPDRYQPHVPGMWGAERCARMIADRKADLARDGVCIISRHDSITGRLVAFYGPNGPQPGPWQRTL